VSIIVPTADVSQSQLWCECGNGWRESRDAEISLEVLLSTLAYRRQRNNKNLIHRLKFLMDNICNGNRKECLNIQKTSDSERKPEYPNLQNSPSRPINIISQNLHAHRKYCTLNYSVLEPYFYDVMWNLYLLKRADEFSFSSLTKNVKFGC